MDLEIGVLLMNAINDKCSTMEARMTQIHVISVCLWYLAWVYVIFNIMPGTNYVSERQLLPPTLELSVCKIDKKNVQTA